MYKELLIKNLLEDFDKNIEINLKFDYEEIRIHSVFTSNTDYDSSNIQSKNWIDEGYLKINSTFSAILFDNQVVIHNSFKLSNQHQISTIKDVCLFNIEKALNKFLSNL